MSPKISERYLIQNQSYKWTKLVAMYKRTCERTYKGMLKWSKGDVHWVSNFFYYTFFTFEPCQGSFWLCRISDKAELWCLLDLAKLVYRICRSGVWLMWPFKGYVKASQGPGFAYVGTMFGLALLSSKLWVWNVQEWVHLAQWTFKGHVWTMLGP